jgi:TetR/AcrR family transcriptional regulator, transcriptional repressor for nem operon
MQPESTTHESKSKLLLAALHVIRAKGYSAMRIEDVCAEAGLTKGSFFHHFEGKEALAVAAAEYWSARNVGFFGNAPYHQHARALDRILAYIDFRRGLIKGDLPDFTCLVGTMVQETYDTHPLIREACERSISAHAATLEADIAEALRDADLSHRVSAKSLALHTQVVIQGAFILAKAKHGPQVAAESLEHLRRYFELLFGQPTDVPAPAARDSA